MSTVSEVRRLPGCVRVLFEDGTYADVPTPLFQLFRVRPGDRIQSAPDQEKKDYASRKKDYLYGGEEDEA